MNAYRGTDPLIADLVNTVRALRERVQELEVQVPKRTIAGNGNDPILHWTGSDFLRLFTDRYREVFGDSYPMEYQNLSYPKAQITKFIKVNRIKAVIYRAYILYLIHDDPWVHSGSRPELPRLWNKKMFQLFLNRLRDGIVQERNINGTFAPVTEKGLSLSQEELTFIRKQARDLS